MPSRVANFLASLALFTLGTPALAAQAAEPNIFDVGTGAPVSRIQLIERLATTQFVLLGEMHDNTDHHAKRGELIAALNTPHARVVAEHLELAKQVQASDDLKASLEQAGFDAQGWDWPLHAPLFSAVLEAGVPLSGGNISRETARNAVRTGASALPEALSQLIALAPLDASVQSRLNEDLLGSHCGHMPASMLDGMRLAQHARDAAMFSALRDSQGKPAILVAGNGHVRHDYGVPALIRQHLPEASIVSVGFIEEDGKTPALEQYRGQFDYVWIVPAIKRDDPCLAFAPPANKAATPVPSTTTTR
ncbi:hypothetical protein ED236_07335 [Pseudomethylobacillus aquaticus]|uniref:Haem-binding uptake Tiki superfamily ChaN domain-containing protein n=1 Tax=Pseudomethylobacillus aquaticus TaxID=2676064 RepID=A0A3N0V0L5_9PROT|nr:ChaN family lipoprotein [Pseudomethylobacillus aquaticus]ROH86245.1 hypothetical protein ED236_07335 [Pseudomethylobacillus aquaticus]